MTYISFPSNSRLRHKTRSWLCPQPLSPPTKIYQKEASYRSGILQIDLIWWKRIFNGRQPLMEDALSLKTLIDGRRHLMEDDLWCKRTFDGRQTLMEGDHLIAAIFFCSNLNVTIKTKQCSWVLRLLKLTNFWSVYLAFE